MAWVMTVEDDGRVALHRALDRGAFRNWLSSKLPSTTVGFPREACICPLANFLRDRLTTGPYITGLGVSGVPSTIQTTYRVTWSTLQGTFQGFIREPWAILFIEYIDLEPVGTCVEAKLALELLDKIQ